MSAAERSRRHRRRRKRGVVFVGVEIGAKVIDYLMDTHRLKQWDEYNVDKIGKAIEDLLAAAVTRVEIAGGEDGNTADDSKSVMGKKSYASC